MRTYESLTNRTCLTYIYRSMHIISTDDAQEILHRSFEISNPNFNEDIGNLLKKDNEKITWTDFTYKIILRLNKRSEQKDSEQKQRPISMASFTGHLESARCNIFSTKPNWSGQISLIYMFFTSNCSESGVPIPVKSFYMF